MAILRSLIVSLVARTENFDQGMRKAEGSLRGFSTATTQFQGKIRGLTTELLKFSAAQAGIATALDVVRKGFQTGLNLERIQADLQRITGSAPAARQAMLQLEQTARETGFSLEVLSQGFTMLQTASRGTTLSFEDVTRIFDQFIRAARATNVAENQLGNVFEELTELLNQQTISLSDLTPLLKQFPGLTDAMAQAMGVNRIELERMSEAGELLTTVVLPRLAEEMGKTTQGATMPLTNAVQQLRAAWDELWRTITESGALEIVTKAIKEVTSAVKDLVNFLKSNESWINKLLQLIPGVDLLRPRTAEAPGTGGLAPGQPRPGDVVPPAEGPPVPATPPAVDTSREREIERLQQEFANRQKQLDALMESTLKRMQQFPRDAETILKGAQEQADQLLRDMQTIYQQMEKALRELEQQGQKTQAQADKTAAAISPQRAAVRARLQELAPQYGLDPRLVEALIKRESNFDPRAVSKAGAQGLMQLMPGTARMLGVQDPFDIEQNLRGGMKYLSDLLKQFNGDMEKALAAYNAGPGRVAQAAQGRPLPAETQKYVPAVLAEYERLKAAGTGAMDATAASTTTASDRLKDLQAQIDTTRQKLAELATRPEEFQQQAERITAENRYIDLLIETQNEIDALVLSEDELRRATLERLQAQAEVQRKMQAAMRTDPAGTREAVAAEIATNLEIRNQLLREQAVDTLRTQQRQGINDLIGGMRDQAAQLSLTTRGYLEYRLALLNATDAERLETLSLHDQVTALETSQRVAGQLTDVLVDLATRGGDAFKDLSKNFGELAINFLFTALNVRQTMEKLINQGINALLKLLGVASGTVSPDVAAIGGEAPLGAITPRQYGGAVLPHRAYLVGERGPELFLPRQGGQVVPHGDMASYLVPPAQSPAVTVNVYTQDASSFVRSRTEIQRAMGQAVRNSVKG